MYHTSKHPNNAASHKNIFTLLLAFANIIALILSILYLINPADNIVTNILGAYLLLILAINLMAATKDRKFSYGYLIYSAIISLAIPILNTVTSSAPTNTASRSYIAIFLILFGFLAGFSYLSYGFLSTNNSNPDRQSKSVPNNRLKLAGILILWLLSFVVLVSALFVCYLFLSGKDTGILEVFLPEYSLFFGFYFLAIAVYAFKLSINRFPILAFGTGVLGMILFILCCLPLFSTPKLLSSANKEYTQAFGALPETDNSITPFKNIEFSIPEYLFGTKTGDYSVTENILYYQGTQGVDKGIKLYFDVYQPAKDSSNLPGKGSALIRIHGGAWNIGDKSASNYAQVNKYFASQGYVVFDIQYGLNNQDKFVAYAPVPLNVQGAFTIDDMIRHIGIFSTYLCDHQDEYGANTDSVFISGGSAGGQLTVAVGLAIANGGYSDILDSRIKVKGIIPFYPANGLANIGGKKELVDPALLVDKNSPPCLIYQGTHDGIVDPQIAKDLKASYTQNENSKCALIMMPLASHGSDFYYSSYYNQVFIYYMERF
ncbi:MAG: alpha/beta hydrolase fold domain-containing protein, partial [Mobilitalea sp.]